MCVCTFMHLWVQYTCVSVQLRVDKHKYLYVWTHVYLYSHLCSAMRVCASVFCRMGELTVESHPRLHKWLNLTILFLVLYTTPKQAANSFFSLKFAYFYLEERVREKESSTCWLSSQMAATARVGPFRSQEPASRSFWVFQWCARTQALEELAGGETESSSARFSTNVPKGCQHHGGGSALISHGTSHRPFLAVCLGV